MIPSWFWSLALAAMYDVAYSSCPTPLCSGAWWPEPTSVDSLGIDYGKPMILGASCPCGSSGWEIALPDELVGLEVRA